MRQDQGSKGRSEPDIMPAMRNAMARDGTPSPVVHAFVTRAV